MDSRIELNGVFYIGLALSFVLIPIRWVFAWFVASFVHELCHLIALRIFRCDVKTIRFGIFGAVITGAPMSDFPAIICSLAGPIGSFLLCFLSRWIPRIAVCGLIQCVYNLIPIQPLDGSKILERILSMCFSENVKKLITMIVRYIVFICLIISCVILCRTSLGLIPLFAVVMVIVSCRKNSLQNGS